MQIGRACSWPPSGVKASCRGAVHLAELREQNPAMVPHDLPDLYEPLICLYERGGEFITDNCGALDLTGVSFRPGRLQGNAYNTQVVPLNDAVLDALDAEERVTFYAFGDDRGTVFRRLLPQGAASATRYSARHWDGSPRPNCRPQRSISNAYKSTTRMPPSSSSMLCSAAHLNDLFKQYTRSHAPLRSSGSIGRLLRPGGAHTTCMPCSQTRPPAATHKEAFP